MTHPTRAQRIAALCEKLFKQMGGITDPNYPEVCNIPCDALNDLCALASRPWVRRESVTGHLTPTDSPSWTFAPEADWSWVPEFGWMPPVPIVAVRASDVEVEP